MTTSVNDADYEALRVRMRDLRVRAGLTQVEMAERLHVGQSFVSKLERGANFFDLLLFVRWCRECDVRPENVLGDLLSVWRGNRLPLHEPPKKAAKNK